MEILLLGLMATAILGGKKDNKKNSRNRRHSRNDDWLDQAWFHDHGQSI